MTDATLSRTEELARVVSLLEEDIIFGRVAPGARLVEDALMARYGASRHFIRQALVQLERSGVLSREKNVGATVCSYTAEEVVQIYAVREMLTRQAALLIPLPAPAALIERLEAIQAEYDRHAETGNLRGIHEANDVFHLEMFAACGNPYLVRTLREYMGLTLPMRAKNLADPAGLRVSRSQHRIMIELLQGTDSWSLAQLCVDHLKTSKDDYHRRVAAGLPPLHGSAA
ncbi:GntR family transcriptional regulator [Bosea sp. BK604]|uniref:GntR family transcriptional regulator n=1 Tax=Bosea sp. BK604 TaxID=2512180 RepID=UPI001044C13B|nr:GntR family transcriptional regulator [Bosea sp. BK604]TCR64770.1 GntR family transcriptional regulator [Bosea sp. BK604]